MTDKELEGMISNSVSNFVWVYKGTVPNGRHLKRKGAVRGDYYKATNPRNVWMWTGNRYVRLPILTDAFKGIF